MSSNTAEAKNKDKSKQGEDTERELLMDFTSLPAKAIQSYINFYDLAQSFPPLDGSTCGSNSNSSSGRRTARRAARATSPVMASSTRKRNADTAALGGLSQSKDRTTEDDPPCPPHFFDADAATHYLGQVATKHFNHQPAPKEGEVVVGFLYKCRTRSQLNQPTAHHRIRESPRERQRFSSLNRAR